MTVCVAGDAEQIESQYAAWARRGQFIRSCGVETWLDGTVSERFAFIHDLYREVAYERTPASRRVRWHQQIGVRLESGYASRAGDMAAELSTHFLRARDGRRAVGYLRQAGTNAMQRHAYQEAIDLLRAGLDALDLFPDTTERLEPELALHLALGGALIAAKGHAALEVETAYVRARQLCEQIGDHPRYLQVLLGLQACFSLRGALETATELGEQCVNLAQRGGEPTRRLQAHYALGSVLLFRGELTRSQEHLDHGTALYRPAYHQPHAVQDPGVTCSAYLGSTLWLRGMVDQALARGRDAVSLAQDLSHPFSLAHALYFTAMVQLYRGESELARESDSALLALAKTYAFPYWSVMGNLVEGRLQLELGDAEVGVAQLSQSLKVFLSTGAKAGQTMYLLWLAESQHMIGQSELGFQMLAQALEAAQHTGERTFEAELYRLQGEYTLQSPAQAETYFFKALETARRQQAHSWELRSATSLARLWQRQGKPQDAHHLLAPVYGWFTEGFDTADLQDAKALLNHLTAI